MSHFIFYWYTSTQGLTIYASLLLLTCQFRNNYFFSFRTASFLCLIETVAYRRRRVVTSNPTGPSLNPLTRLDTGAWRGSIELTSLLYRSRFADESEPERRTIKKLHKIRIIDHDFTSSPPLLNTQKRAYSSRYLKIHAMQHKSLSHKISLFWLILSIIR